MKRLAALFATLVLAACATGAAAQTQSTTIPTPDGAVFITDADAQSAYDQIGFAPSRRAGDVLYVSGVIVYRGEGEGNDMAAFRTQARRAFVRLDQHLRAAGLTFNNVTMINSFHVWTSPHFSGSPIDQVTVMNELKDQYITGPHPAWTAVGTTGLLADTGIIEIQLIAHYPRGAQSE